MPKLLKSRNRKTDLFWSWSCFLTCKVVSHARAQKKYFCNINCTTVYQMTSVITEVFLVILQLYLFGRGVRIHYHTLKNCLQKKTKTKKKNIKSIKMIYLTHIIVILLFSFIYLPNKLPTEWTLISLALSLKHFNVFVKVVPCTEIISVTS